MDIQGEEATPPTRHKWTVALAQLATEQRRERETQVIQMTGFYGRRAHRVPEEGSTWTRVTELVAGQAHPRILTFGLGVCSLDLPPCALEES